MNAQRCPSKADRMTHRARMGLFLDIDKIARQVSGKCVSHMELRDDRRLTIHFVDGSALFVERLQRGLAVDMTSQNSARECAAGLWPTSRQREYLEFIKKYMPGFVSLRRSPTFSGTFSCLRPQSIRWSRRSSDMDLSSGRAECPGRYVWFMPATVPTVEAVII